MNSLLHLKEMIKMSKRYQHWTEREVKQLIKLNSRKRSLCVMSEKLGRSTNSIRLKLRALGVELLNKPIRVYTSKKNRLGNIYHPDYQRN